jgi:internalin A
MDSSEIWPEDILIQRLSLSDLGLEDIHPIGQYQQINDLELDHNNISDLEPLRMLSQLKKLDISFNAINDLGPITALEQIEQLLANHLELKSLPESITWPKLKELSLSGNNQLKSIESSINCKGIEALYLRGCPLSDLSPIGQLQALTTLNLTYLATQNWQPIADLTHLKRLYINGRALVDISQLPVLKQVAHLWINQCPALVDISPLAQWTGLKSLNLNYNAISDFSPLLTLPSLERLEIKGNPGTLPPGMMKDRDIALIVG